MNTPTPTPRTDAAWSASFEPCEYRAAHTARTMRDCSQQLETELTALTAERDQLRSDCENETKWAAHYLAQSIADKSRAEKAERAETVALANWNGALERAMKAEGERDHLHAQLRALTLICGTNDANKFETWIDRANARAEHAEAELTAEREKAERYRLATLKLDAELTAERARLDAGTILLTVAGERVWHCGVDLRAAIDAAMKEGGA